MHDWSLLSLAIDWGSGDVRLDIRSPEGMAVIHAAGLHELRLPRAQTWGPSVSINAVKGPTLRHDGLSCLVIEMQSGDLIEITAHSIDMPGGVRYPG
jgi:hypothetical protein